MSSTSRAARCAEELVEELGLQAPEDLDIELIAAHHDVFVTYRPLEAREGHLLRGAGVGLIVVDTDALESCKWRFVIAHELGHYVLHADADQFHLCTNAEAHHWYRASGLEAQANVFASHLLLPDALFLPAAEEVEADPTLENLSALAHRFRTSLTATALKFIRKTERACALIHSRHNRIDWCACSPNFIPKIRAHTTLKPHTYAAALWRNERLPQGPLPIQATCWSGTLRAAHLTLFEHSIQSGQYDSVLTWITHE